MMKRGEVYDARLDPVEGSEQRGSRPVVIVSRDAINESSHCECRAMHHLP
jgi:mRNA interferase MazF